MLQYVEQRMKAFSGVAWPDMGGRGCYNRLDQILRMVVNISHGIYITIQRVVLDRFLEPLCCLIECCAPVRELCFLLSYFNATGH
jgi:hypothetical protein